MVSIIDFVSGKIECEVCKATGRRPPGRLWFEGKKSEWEKEGDFWHFGEYEMKCDTCGAVMQSEGARLLPAGHNLLRKRAGKTK